jgi:hypothetical protein
VNRNQQVVLVVPSGGPDFIGGNLFIPHNGNADRLLTFKLQEQVSLFRFGGMPGQYGSHSALSIRAFFHGDNGFGAVFRDFSNKILMAPHGLFADQLKPDGLCRCTGRWFYGRHNLNPFILLTEIHLLRDGFPRVPFRPADSISLKAGDHL